jgi:antitoxin HicB
MAENKLEAQIEHYLRLPYRLEVSYDEDHWAATFPELPGLVAGHETWDGLLAAIDDAKRTYFEAALERGLPIPDPTPREEPRYSGRLLVRMPATLHRWLVKQAEQEGVSLNQFAVALLARGWR